MSGFECKSLMLVTVKDRLGDRVPTDRTGCIELADRKTCRQHSGEGAVEVCFGHKTFVDRLFAELLESVTAIQILAVDHRDSRRFSTGCHIVMLVEHVLNCAAVGGDESVKPSLVAEDVNQEFMIRATGDAVEGVVGTHHRPHVSLLDSHLEGRQIVFTQVTVIYIA